MKKIVTFLSDFGSSGGYVSQMKAVVLSLCDACLVDVSHDIAPQNVRECAFVLRSVVPFFPVGSVHVCVVDPGVGTDRRGILVASKKHVFVGPDNGLLIPAARLFGDFKVFLIENEEFMVRPVSDTFHGRDVFASVAGHVVNGVSFERFGRRVSDFVDMDFGPSDLIEGGVVGEVLFGDRFGNVVTNISSSMFFERFSFGENCTLRIGKKRRKVVCARSFGHVSSGELLVYVGSSDFVEVGVNRGSAFEVLGVSVGDVVSLVG